MKVEEVGNETNISTFDKKSFPVKFSLPPLGFRRIKVIGFPLAVDVEDFIYAIRNYGNILHTEKSFWKTHSCESRSRDIHDGNYVMKIILNKDIPKTINYSDVEILITYIGQLDPVQNPQSEEGEGGEDEGGD